MRTARLFRRPLVAALAALSAVAALSCVAAARAAHAEDAKPSPWATAEAAVVAAEKVDKADKTDAGPKARAAARAAVDAAVAANPSAVTPHLLSARVWVLYGLPAKTSQPGQQAFMQALVECSKAAEIDVRDPEPWRLRVAVLDAMNAPKEDQTEGLRALAVRLPPNDAARDEFKKRTGKIPQLRNGDPMPLVVWKDSAGKDVAVADLWAPRPLVIELFRTTSWCEFCRKRLYELHEHSKDFEAANATLVAVSPESPDLVAAIEKDGLKGRKPFRVRLLIDPQGKMADRLSVLNQDSVKPGTAPDAFGLPYPTTIVVDTKGIIRFVDTHEDFRDRTKIDQILPVVKRIHELAAAKPTK